MLTPIFGVISPGDAGYGNFSEAKRERMLENVRSIPDKVHVLCLEEEVERINFLISCGWISRVDYKHEGDWVYIEKELV